MNIFLYKTTILVIAILTFTNCYSQSKKTNDSENNTSQTAKSTRASGKMGTLISELEEKEWSGAVPITSPLQWGFRFTEPMENILKIGKPAQDDLLKEIENPLIKDQIIILLGGVGDEKSVEPIINAMVSESDIENTPNAEKINLTANIALTNITVADVIWHHGGGIVKTDPPANSKQLWANWWENNKESFSVKKITQSRSYSNYPNYGIYKDLK